MENKKTHAGKTLLSAFLAFVLAVSMTPMPAYADEAAGESGTTTSGAIGVEGATLEATTPQETAVPLPAGKTLTYNGEWQLGIDPAEGWTFECADGVEGHFDPETGCHKTDAGEYECTLRLKEGYVWENGSHDDATVAWSIQPKAIAAPAGSELTANGEAQQGVSAGEGYDLSGDTEATEAGNYTATATLQPNYIWDDSTTEPKQIAWSIVADGQVADGVAIEGEDVKAQAEEDPEVSAQALISVSIPKGGTFYCGSDELEEWFNTYYSYDRKSGNYVLKHDGAIAATAGIESDELYSSCYCSGEYNVIYRLESGYCWPDGTTGSKSIILNIEEDPYVYEKGSSGEIFYEGIRFDIASCNISLDSDVYTYNGRARKPDVTIYGEKTYWEWNGEFYDYYYMDDELLEEGIDYTVTYSNNVKAGTASITIKGIGYYYGTATRTFVITPSTTGWFKLDNAWYYRTNSGLASGWKTIGNAKYYFNPKNNKMATGLWNISGKKYYFSNDGAMQKNSWKSYNGSWYYFSSTGAAKSGWLSQGGTWYYLNPSNNKMATGLWNIDGKKYCFNSNGTMASSCWKSYGGDWYYFSSTGAAKSGWLSQGGTWYYLDSETKAMVTGLKKIGGKSYYFNRSGAMASNRWERIDYSWYYFTSSGAAKKGWLQWGGNWYWFDSTGRGASNEGIHLGDGYHFFDYDGVWVKSASMNARGWIKVVNRTYYYDGDYCDWDTKLYYVNSRGELLGVDTNAWSYRIGDYYYDFSRDGAYYRENVYTGESEYWSHHGDCYYYYGCDGCYWASYY